MNIELLAEHPESIPVLVDWYMSEWEPYYGPNGPGDAHADLRSRCNRDEIPIGLVAVEDGAILGTAAVDVDEATGLRPSVVGILVTPAQRRRGFATALLKGAESLARQLGYGRLFVSTAILGELLVRMGWHSQRQVKFASNELGTIYAKDL